MPVVVLESAGERVSQPHRLKVGLRRRGRASWWRAARALELVCFMKSCGFRCGREAFLRVGEPALRLGEWRRIASLQAPRSLYLEAVMAAGGGGLLVWADRRVLGDAGSSSREEWPWKLAFADVCRSQ